MTVLNLKIEKALKTEAQAVAEAFGIPLGTIINALLRQLVHTKEISLNVSGEPTPFLKSVIRESEDEFAKDKTNRSESLEGKDFIKKLKKL
jgi:addiction module RelB/DinJ family antitoxin